MDRVWIEYELLSYQKQEIIQNIQHITQID
jgi:hypothetical protein